MTKSGHLTNKDLIDFKDSVIGSGYGSVKPFRTIFGIKSATYYAIKNHPEKPLSLWHAAHLRAYKVMTFDELYRVFKDAHDVDLKEL